MARPGGGARTRARRRIVAGCPKFVGNAAIPRYKSPHMQIVTLTTDFGLQDWFVGAMKGVIAGIAPDARVVDISHGIPYHDVRAGAFALMSTARYFPEGTIHVAVVDPGVGSERSAIAATGRGQVFIGPDNGLLSWAIGPGGADDIFRIENPEIILADCSATFHGRDIFASAAAHLATGKPLTRLGPRRADMIALRWPLTMACTDGTIHGEVIYIDRYGNSVTNFENTLVRSKPSARLQLADGMSAPIGDYYQSVPENEVVAVCGSTGYLEIAVNGGNASQALGLRVGDGVLLG